MKRRCSGFTLLELMAAMLIIAVISSLVLGIYGFVKSKGDRSRAQAEITMFGASIGAYAADFGGPPQTSETDILSPLTDFDPGNGLYKKAGLDLYKALSGDYNANLRVDPEEGKPYLKEIDLNKIVKKNADGTEAQFFKDPYNYAYGYSTAALKGEQTFKDEIRRNGRSATRPDPRGFNASGYDMWCTAGNKTPPPNDEKKKSLWMEWVKNW